MDGLVVWGTLDYHLRVKILRYTRWLRCDIATWVAMTTLLFISAGCSLVRPDDTINFEDPHIDYSDYPYHG